MKEQKEFEEIVKLETTLKCHYVDECLNFTDILKWAKLVEPTLYKELVKKYKKHYGDANDFWD